MNNTEIRKAFQEIAERFGNNEKEKTFIYQFLNTITINNTNEQIEVILELIKINL